MHENIPPGIPFDSIPTHNAYAVVAARLQSDLFAAGKLTFRLKSAELTFSINIYSIRSGNEKKYKIISSYSCNLTWLLLCPSVLHFPNVIQIGRENESQQLKKSTWTSADILSTTGHQSYSANFLDIHPSIYVSMPKKQKSICKLFQKLMN